MDSEKDWEEGNEESSNDYDELDSDLEGFSIKESDELEDDDEEDEEEENLSNDEEEDF
jgi:hypothetical protein